MPRLSELTDAYYDPAPAELPVEKPLVKEDKGYIQDEYFSKPHKPLPELPSSNIVEKLIKTLAETKMSEGHPLGNQLFGTGGEERYQLWPERLIREGATAAGDVMSGKVPQWSIDKDTGEVHTSPQMVEKAQEMSALAGTGGLAGVTDATLGATPFLRPALKYKDKLYKGKEGQQHLDVIPENLYTDFQKKAMSGDDIAEYNFGFINDKGHFLDREKALKYGIDTGIIDPQAGKFGALTSTLMADSSKPGVAIESLKGPKLKLQKEGENRFFINDESGKELGRLAVDYADGDLNIVNVASPQGPNSFGPSAIRDLLPQLLEHYPDTKVIGGFRAGGARAKNNSTNKVVEYKLRPVDFDPFVSK